MTSPSKKRGRPAGSKKNPKPFKQINTDILLSELIEAEGLCEEMIKTIEALELKIKNFMHKEMQYKVVIDYLETKLEIN